MHLRHLRRLPDAGAPRFEVDTDHGIAKWEVFPYGIIDWDRFHVRIAFEVNELEARVSQRGFNT